MRKSFILFVSLICLLGCNSTQDQTKIIGLIDLKTKIDNNLQKDGQELLEDMAYIIESGLIKFEIYDLEGRLIKIISKPEDFNITFKAQFDPSSMNIKSVKSERAIESPLLLISQQ
jgi:hypothetical protein